MMLVGRRGNDVGPPEPIARESGWIIASVAPQSNSSI